MKRSIASLVITMMVSGCAVENFDPNKVRFKMSSDKMSPSKMFDKHDGLTPSQRTSLMSGEQPDWGKDEVISVGYGVAW